jgi:DNA-binding transcriptional MerR regulator
MDDDLLTIGNFGRLSGLTVKALRYYDRVALIVPASVDMHTGYRRYERSQLKRARTIRRLRDLDVPLDGIRLALDGDPGAARSVLERQRSVIEAETLRLQRIGHRLRMALMERSQEGELMADTIDDLQIGGDLTHGGTSVTSDGALDTAQEREVAVELFNLVWTLLERSDRTRDDDDRMVHAAHASRYHWGQVGTAENHAVGEWQCSRVYAALGREEPCLHHATRALEIARAGSVPDWVGASALEAMARACAVAGDEEAARSWADAAKVAAASISDEEDREVVMGDIATLPID